MVDDIIDQVKATPDDWVWSYHQSPENLRDSRINTLYKFLDDYNLGQKEQRYLVDFLPNLSFYDNSFDLVLCSHFLFLYSDHYDLSFHEKSIQEMLRVGREVRIFPLLTLNLQPSPYLDSIQKTLTEQGYNVSIIEVEYQFQKGGNKMLVIQCPYSKILSD
ncbi:class I SAM-dependent methyltransferase [Aphanothece sacrum]|uniref:SAM-dependent methyltransferase n=1 Tax=Aphanothece sacrum FPU1 TaxID=1920663 RepID=A0A401INY6_APHSA|nr:class I SAM-dependent methyltransferase [Aphanothece sacrum]GBF82947.1 SAM-dependent methyltransferase [Aphanothece sacrum FPU1]GBF86907.1 SAM-dependent methyltransferase [Aphanothece sacrum FPU3]